MVPSCIGCPCFLSNSFFLVPFSSLFPSNGSPGTLLFCLLLATLRSEFLKTLFPWLMQFLSRSLLELHLSFFTNQAVLSLSRFLRLWKTNCAIRKPCKQTKESTKINRVIWKTVLLGNLYLLFECNSEIPCTICSWMVYSNNFEVSWPTDFKIKYCSSGHQKCNIKEKGH